MRTAEEVVRDINSARRRGDGQGLRNTAALLEVLHAWPECPAIHIAGTNGKGSVCAMLSAVLTAAGYRTGLYSSPFLQKYNERIRICGVPVSDAVLAREGNAVLDAAEKLERERGFQMVPFELGTALALRIFREEKAEVMILETGLGGRLDPTNVIPKPAVCGITAIGMDHMELLGNTLEAIAAEKAGILKPGVPAVCWPWEDPAIEAAAVRAAGERQAPLTLLRKAQAIPRESTERYTLADFETGGNVRRNVRLSLPGEHQVYNALEALAVTDELRNQGMEIPESAVREGLAHTFWPGRLEWQGNILLDGAHNAQGLQALGNFIRKYLKGKRIVLLTGVLREKMTREALHALSALAEEAVTVAPPGPRAMSAEELRTLLCENGVQTAAAEDVRSGLKAALDAAAPEGIVLATGSLYFIGTVRDALGLAP